MTTDVDARYLESFPQWLRTLGNDAEAIAQVTGNDKAPEAARRALVGGLNYMFKSMDLIPDGIDDIGYLDDAFILRVSASLAVAAGLSGDEYKAIATLAADTDLIKSFLDAEYPRLEHYVQSLARGTTRGRSVDDVLTSAPVRGEFSADVHGFARSYAAPSFTREEKTLIKLRAFLDAKLPR